MLPVAVPDLGGPASTPGRPSHRSIRARPTTVSKSLRSPRRLRCIGRPEIRGKVAPQQQRPQRAATPDRRTAGCPPGLPDHESAHYSLLAPCLQPNPRYSAGLVVQPPLVFPGPSYRRASRSAYGFRAPSVRSNAPQVAASRPSQASRLESPGAKWPRGREPREAAAFRGPRD